MDAIVIKELEVYGHHGVYKEENVLGQKFLINVVLYTHTKKAGKTDNLDDSFSYAKVAHEINTFFEKHMYKLIESVAENLAKNILMKFPVLKVDIEVKKPWAPILLPLDTVSVKITRKWHKVYLSLGSNMGDKEENIKQAITMLHDKPTIKVVKVSKLFKTKPYGGVEQDDFLNGAAEIDTLLEPYELLEEIYAIEKALKRERLIHWGPRTIDVDILLYDNLVLREDDLCIPHIEMHKRDFVLRPMMEIAPQAEHPLLKQNIYQLFTAMNGN